MKLKKILLGIFYKIIQDKPAELKLKSNYEYRGLVKNICIK